MKLYVLSLSIGLCFSIALAQNTDTSVEVADQEFIMGDSMLTAANYELSISHFEKAASLYQEVNLWQKHFRSVNKITENYRKLKQLDKSVALANQVIIESTEQLGENNAELAVAYNNLGTVHGSKKEYSTAMEYFKRAGDIQQSILGDSHLDLAQTYNNMGIVYRHWKKYSQSLEFFQKSITIKKEVLGDGTLVVARTYNNLGTLFKRMGDHARSVDYYERALAIRLELLGNDHPDTEAIYYNLALGCEKTGDYSTGLDHYFKALYYRKRIFGENHIKVANVYAKIGLLNAYNQDYNLALDYLEKSLAIKEETYGKIHRYVARAYDNIGTTYENLGKYELALANHEKALSIYSETVDDKHPDLAFVYNNLGVANDFLGNSNEAMNYYKRSLSLREEILDPQNPRLAFSYRILGWAYDKRNDYRQALLYHEKALKLRETVLSKKHPDLARSYYDVAATNLKLGNNHKALTYCQKSFVANVIDYNETSITSNPPLDNFLDQYVLLNSLLLKANAYQKQYHLSQELPDLTLSLAALETGDRLIGLIRKNHLDSQDKLALGQTTPEIYKKAIEVCSELYLATADADYHNKAFYFSEKSKAGVLQLALLDNSAKSFGGIPDSLIGLESKIKTDAAFYRSQIQQRKKNKSGYDTTLVKGYEADLFALNRRSDSLSMAFEINYPKYHQLKYQENVFDVTKVQDNLFDSNSAFIEYFVSDSILFAFIVSKYDFGVASIPLDHNFNLLLQKFRSALTLKGPSKNQELTQNELASLGHTMYNQLFSPVKEQLPAGIDKLTIVPHGALSFVPFELMVTQEMNNANLDFRGIDYLLQDYQISYAYSGTLWAQEQTPKKNWENQLTAYAPSYEPSQLALADELGTYGNFRNEIADLKYTKEEIMNAASFFEGSTFIGMTATEGQFKQAAGKSQILHLAMHAIIDEVNPMQSKLIFTQSEDSIEDGYLNAFELYSMQLNAEMAVLSACNTGYGRLDNGEGVMSLGRAFAYAGCPSMVMSLWPAQDQATADIMTYFYEGLSKGYSKDKALREAKLKYLETAEDLFTHPFYWAGFVVQGDPRPLHLNASFSTWWITVIGLVGCSLLSELISRKKRKTIAKS